MIKAVIFDMDGLLIDSEPFWKEASMKVFQRVGVPLTIEMTKETMGFRVNEVVEHWFAKYPWQGETIDQVSNDIMQEVINLVNEKGQAMEGVNEIITILASQNIPMAIASSSFVSIIDAILAKLAIRDKFKVIYSAEHEPYGKPHPGVYITCAQKLGFSPNECLAFEDSPNGVLSAKAAKMKCVAVPDKGLADHKMYTIADLTINSLKDFTISDLDVFRS